MNIWKFALLLALLVPAPACKNDDHDHDDHKKSEKKPEHDEHHDEVKLTPEAIKYFGIAVEPVSRRVLRPTFAAPATIAFDDDRVAHVGTLVSGRVIEIKAKVGDRVKQGDTLLVINSPQWGDLQLNLFEKRIHAAAAKPAVEAAKSAYERAKGLYDKGQTVALAEVERLLGEYRTADAALAQATGEITSAANRLTMLGADENTVRHLAGSGAVDPHYLIKAPMDGTVIERHASMGEAVHPERDSLFMLADESVNWALVDVPEARVSETRAGGRAFVTVPSLGKVMEAEVGHVSSRLDPATRTVAARIVLKDVPGLKAGMFAQVEIESSAPATPEPLMTVPESAVQIIDGATAVFVPVNGEPNTFVKRAVQVGDRVGPWVPVLAGLKDGEQVVTTGSFVLKADLGKAAAGHDD